MSSYRIFGVFPLLVVLLAQDAGAWSLWPFGKEQPPPLSLPTTTEAAGAKSGLQPTKKTKEDTVSIERLEMLAYKQKNPDAQLALGRMYYEGVGGVEQDFEKAGGLFHDASVGGSERAVYNYGLCLTLGRGVPKDEEKGLEWFIRAAEMGVPQAQQQAGLALEARKQYDKAFPFFRAVAETGELWAIHKTATYLLEGLGTEKNPVQAVQYLEVGARRGDPRCQVRLADCYEQGLGVPTDYEEMFSWLYRAAHSDDPEAQAKVGCCFLRGQGVARNTATAFKWFERSANAGYAPGQVYMGNCYLQGAGVGQDLEKSVAWYRLAADQEDPIGEFSLGVAYELGRGVAGDPKEALRWFKRAADRGYAPAQFNLGVMLEEGWGVPADLVKALPWYRAAAKQGSPEANLTLGRLYLKGEGVPLDRDQAKQYLTVAAEAGSDAAKDDLKTHF